MARKVIGFVAILVLGAALGCSNNDEDPNAFLNAPEVKEPISKEKAGADRGDTPEQMKQMDEPARGGAKR